MCTRVWKDSSTHVETRGQFCRASSRCPPFYGSQGFHGSQGQDSGCPANTACTVTCPAISLAPRLAFYFLVFASFPARSFFCSWSQCRGPHFKRDFWLGTHRSHLPGWLSVIQAWRSCTCFLWFLSMKLLKFPWMWPITPMGMDRGKSNVTLFVPGGTVSLGLNSLWHPTTQ